MPSQPRTHARIGNFQPLTRATWNDFEQVMGVDQGGEGGCWCTWWRVARSEWQQLERAGRKQLIQRLVCEGQPTGVIGYSEGEAVGWCAIAPTQDYPVLARSPVVAPSLLEGDWFVSCFFVKAGHRRGGAMRRLLQHAVDYARAKGAKAIEACPRDRIAASGSGDLFVGKTAVFLALGFQEVHRNRPDRPLVRLAL